MRVFVLLRVSGRSQATEGTGLEGQEAACRRYLASAGIHDEPIVRVDVESATGRDERSGVRELVREAQRGDLIVLPTVDRWARRLAWGLRTIQELTERGVRVYAVREGLDASTAQGAETIGLMLWVAEREARAIRDRTVGRADELRRAGEWAYGTVPWGYARGPRAERRQRQLSPDDAAPLVVEMHERLADGQSLRDVTAWTAPRGGPRHVAALHRLVRGRIYLGEIWVGRGHHQREGEWAPGQHPPLVTREIWQRVQDALDGRRSAPQPARSGAPWAQDLLLPGAAVCALCGRRVTIGRAENRWGTIYRYYVCAGRRRVERDPGRRIEGATPKRCPGPYVRAESLDEAAEEAVLGRLRELREVLAARPRRAAERGEAVEDFARARRGIEARLARAVSAYTDGTLTAAELATQRGRLDGEIAKLRDREASAARERRAADPAARGDLQRALGDLRRTWRGMLVPERRRVVRLLAARVELGEDGGLRWTWRTVEDLLAE
jgi:DNA invertase Pin-like site-specific DNA recombinase